MVDDESALVGFAVGLAGAGAPTEAERAHVLLWGEPAPTSALTRGR